MSRRLKILQVGKYYAPYRGGMEAHLEELSRGLLPHADVEVVVANTERREVSELVSGVPVRRLPTLMTVASTPLCPGLFAAVAGSKADIVHLHLPNPVATFAALRLPQDRPLVATYQGDIVRQRVLGLLHAPFLRRILGRCSAVIATSPTYIEPSPYLRDFASRCRVIPMGIAYERYLEADPAAEEIRRRHGPRLVLAVGRLIYYKGFDVLVDAMRAVDGRLVVIGEGPLRGALQSRIARAGLSGRVSVLGTIPDLRPYYQAADVFVLPSTQRAESFGIVQLEAMACGKPVVNTDITTGVPWVSPGGVTGLTVRAGDSKALAQALNRLLGDEPLRRKLGEAGRRRVQETFGVDLMIKDTLRLYEEVARR